ncbi:MAG: tetratricopeptide repeat protein [Myxococcales bacterium]
MPVLFSLVCLSAGAAPNLMADFQAALSAERAGDASAASRGLEAVCAGAPTWALPRIELAQLCLSSGDAARARALADEAVRLDAESPRGWHLLALADEALSDAPGAVAADSHALALRPGYSEAEEHLARVEWNAGQHSAAIDLYLKIVAERPDDLASLATLASAEEEDGRLEAAEQALRTLVEMEPRAPAWHRRLALLFEREGKSAEAAAELGRVERLSGEKKKDRHLRPLLPSRR